MTDTQIKQKIKQTFNDVAPRYDTIDFFKISAKNISGLLFEHDTSHILDVASGTGNVVLECAKAKPHAKLDAVDISDEMLAQARRKTQNESINNIEFHCCDIESLDMQKKYDAITCSYALFFLPNPVDTLKLLYEHLNENGVLIFSSFTSDAFTPSSTILVDLLNSYGIQTPPNDWKMLKKEEDIAHLCKLAEIDNFTIQSRDIRYPLSIEQWWALNNDAGYRGYLTQLSTDNYEELKTKYFEAMRGIHDSDQVELIADTYYTVIRK